MANRATRRANISKNVKGDNKRGTAQAATVTKPSVTVTVVDDSNDTAEQRIAKMIGDNWKPFYKVFDDVAQQIGDTAAAFEDKQRNQSLDWIVALYNLREDTDHVDLTYLRAGKKEPNKVTANDAQTSWLRRFVPAFEQYEKAGNRKWQAIPNEAKQTKLEAERDEAKAAAEAIRTMFGRVVRAAWYLQNVEASELLIFNKGKSKRLQFKCVINGNTEDGNMSVNKLVASADTRAIELQNAANAEAKKAADAEKAVKEREAEANKTAEQRAAEAKA